MQSTRETHSFPLTQCSFSAYCEPDPPAGAKLEHKSSPWPWGSHRSVVKTNTLTYSYGDTQGGIIWAYPAFWRQPDIPGCTKRWPIGALHPPLTPQTTQLRFSLFPCLFTALPHPSPLVPWLSPWAVTWVTIWKFPLWPLTLANNGVDIQPTHNQYTTLLMSFCCGWRKSLDTLGLSSS